MNNQIIKFFTKNKTIFIFFIIFWFINILVISLTNNAQNFNNIITPLGSIFSSFLYLGALLLLADQNMQIISQNSKPYYEDEIKKLHEIGKKDIPCYIKKYNMSIAYKNIRN